MAFRGDLNDICLFDVFQNLVNNQLTGTLHLQVQADDRWLWFEDGKVRLASVGRRIGLPMQDFLVRRGWVDEEALTAARKRHRRGRPALRNVLAREGLVDEESFRAAFTDRLQEFIYALFEWKNATFEFQEGAAPKGVFDREQRGVGVALNPMPVLMEAARREDEWERIRKVIATDRDLFVRAGAELPSLDPDRDSDLAAVWQELDGTTEMRDLELVVPLGRFELHDLVSTLVVAGYARAVGAAEIVAQAEAAMNAGDHARTRALLEHAIEIERNNRDLRRMLAELYEVIDDRKQAAEQWAMVGYQANLAAKDAEATMAYGRALALAPTDLGIREKSVELLGRTGSTEAYATATLELVVRFHDLGLGERACDVIDRAMERPDLADRPELLVVLAQTYAAVGRKEDGLRRIVTAAETARRLGDRAHAEAVLRAGLGAFPEDAQLEELLAELRTRRKEGRRKLVRRALALAALTGFAATTGVIAFDEVMLRHDVNTLVRDLPIAVHEGRSTTLLGSALARAKAHPFTPSRSLFVELAHGLTEAELAVIRREGYAGHYREALARIEGLRALVGNAASAGRIANLYESLQRQQDLWDGLEPWFAEGKRAARVQRRLDVFEFSSADAEQVVALYGRLDATGKQRVRERLAELGTPVGLPAFTQSYLEGLAPEDDESLPLVELIGALAARAREPRWRSNEPVRAAFLNAYKQVAEAYIGGTVMQRRRAQQLLPSFVERPARWPADWRGFRALLGDD